MARQIHSMVAHRLDGMRQKRAGARALEAHFRGIGEVFAPEDAEEPILAAPVRGAVFEWLTEINARDALAEIGLKPRSTCLLEGPPGCGKTTLAHHLAARLGIPMLVVGAENIFAKYLGDSERTAAKLFDAAESAEQPFVLFIDEFDSIGAKRVDTSSDSGGAVTARNATLTVLLRKIEQFDGLMVAATNRADALDPAIWRRFGMQIKVDLPDDESRWAIIKRYSLPFDAPPAIIDELADLCAGASPALLRQMMEGIKRQIVLGPRLRRPSDSWQAAIETVTAAIAPHPDYTPPVLWTDRRRSLAEIAHAAKDAAWPPARTSTEKKDAA